MSELSNSVLPCVLVEDILARLPVKPVGRFRCVSKPWRSLISSPKFLKSHHELHILKPTGYLTFTRRWAVHYILTLASAESSTTMNDGTAVDLQTEVNCFDEVQGSCNGLLLFKNRDHFLLINPITLETVQILDDRDHDRYKYRCFYGFGYDKSSDDYKIVSLSRWNLDPRKGSILDVYSVRMKRWKRIANDCPYTAYHSAGVFLNGCIHWFGYDNSPRAILCFDLASEEFVEGLFPPSVKKEFVEGEFLVDRIKVFDGCLAMVSHFHNDTLKNLWVMRKYGVRDSWTKLIAICLENTTQLESSDFICELNEDEIVVQEADDYEPKLVAHNWRNGTSRDLDFPSLLPCSYLGRVTPFKGSVLSPNL